MSAVPEVTGLPLPDVAATGLVAGVFEAGGVPPEGGEVTGAALIVKLIGDELTLVPVVGLYVATSVLTPVARADVVHTAVVEPPVVVTG